MHEALQDFDNLNFTHDLVEWYEKNKRPLPWRQTTNPYKIWISEIMLQQTQVDTVIPYYEKFLEHFPTIYDLAKADETLVLKLWAGLGYYSRARNIHTAAKTVVAEYDGKMPNEVKTLGALKGIGPYTRGAILSIAFNQAEPAVDGNVFRVLSRVLNISDNISEGKTRKKFEAIVRILITHVSPQAFNQALMELGAIICTPKKPQCLYCPVREYCRGFKANVVHQLPVKQKAKKQKLEKYTVILLKNELGDIAIEQRPTKGLLANMWQFPMIKGHDLSNEAIQLAFKEIYDANIQVSAQISHLKHVFTHIIWQLEIVQASIDIESNYNDITFVTREALGDLPISTSHLKIKKLL